jgi:tripartite-type tricarboxylate transporter receptor subunit TctC
MNDKSHYVLAATLAGGAGLAAPMAQAQAWPARQLSLVVAFSAGGPTDTLARITAERMRRSLGQTVVVENVVGASGTLGVGRVARAAPDGYQLILGHWGTHVLSGAVINTPYDVYKDFEPVAMIATNPLLLVTRNTMPAANVKELIAWLKANPAKATYGTSGVGSASHVSGVYFQNLTGTKFEAIPYKGGAPAMADVMGGQIDLMFDQAASSVPLVRNGKVKAYAVTDKVRLAAAPDIPMADEAGLKGFYIAIWHGIWAPRGTPKDVIAKLNSAVVDTLADTTVRQRFADLGQEIPARERQTPEALSAYHKAEIDKWFPMIKAAGIKAE